MLRELHIANFKCFESITLPLAPLTLLSGVNGGGKSSVIQSLVLLNQSLMEREWDRSLLLDGPELALGNATDVLNQRFPRRPLMLGLSTEHQRVLWTFKAADKRALTLELRSVSIDERIAPLGDSVRWLLPASQAESSGVARALRRLSWITAERTGPRELLPLRDEDGHRYVGTKGELSAGLLYWRGDDDVRLTVCKSGVPPTLQHQVRARMQEFFPGCDFEIKPVDGVSAVTLRLRSDARSDFQRPQNVGFGLTQLFPILVAFLAAQPDDILLVENPEVHLHPRAQQSIGELIGLVAANGVQVVAETHSDHVLNGIRLAVKRGTLPPRDVAVHFFAPTEDGSSYVPLSPQMDRDGRLDKWPEGFFDQFDVALSELL